MCMYYIYSIIHVFNTSCIHVWILSVCSWTMMEYWKWWSPKIIYLFNFGAHICIFRSPKVALLPCQDLFGNSSKPTLPHQQQMIWLACTPLHLLFSCFSAAFQQKVCCLNLFATFSWYAPPHTPTPGYLLCLVTCLLPLEVRLICFDPCNLFHSSTSL